MNHNHGLARLGDNRLLVLLLLFLLFLLLAVFPGCVSVITPSVTVAVSVLIAVAFSAR
jgi:hypothetical protein